MKIGAIYYTTSELDSKIAVPCQKQLIKSIGEENIVSVSLKPLDFGHNITLPLEKGYTTYFLQIYTALMASKADHVFFCEHDVLYHQSHFEFIPPKNDTYYYNTNVWWIRYEDGHSLWVDEKRQVSGLCANRELLLAHYKERLKRMSVEGFTRRNGFEPGKHITHGGYDNHGMRSWLSKYPNLDIRHDQNLSNRVEDPKWKNWRWHQEDYKNPKYTQGWTEGDETVIPGWNIPQGQFQQFLASV